MARRTLSDFDDELVLRLGNRSDLTSAMRTQFIQDAVIAIANMFDHQELQGVTSQTVLEEESSLTPNVDNIWWPTFVQNFTLKRPVDYSSLVSIESKDKPSGPLTEYYWYNGVLYFDHEADEDTVLTIWYKTEVEELEAGDSAPFNQMFDPLVPMWAAKLAYETVGNLEQAAVQEKLFRVHLTGLRLPTYEHERNDRRKGIRVRMR